MIDKLGRAYQCDDAGKRFYNIRKKPPQYDSHIWAKLGPEGRSAVLDYFARADDKHDGLTVDGKFITDFDLTHAEIRADEQADYPPYKDGDYLSFNSE